MKVLHVIDHLGLGGAQRLATGLFNCQPENEDIFLFALRSTGISMHVHHENVFVYPSSSRFSIVPLIRLISLVKQKRIDVVHCHLLRSQLLGYLLKKIFFPKIKLIFHEHGRIFQTRKTYPTLLKLIQGQVDRFIAVSEATKSKLVDKASVKPQNIRTLYNFIDLDAFNNAAHPKSKDEIRSRYGISEFAFVVGFAGRIVPSKGWKEFISSIPLLIEQNQTIKFVIAGDGPDKRAMLAMIAALEVDQHVHFLGYQPNMQEFYAMLDCFVVASHRESMGLTVVEAKAMGVPVVSSDVPALNALTQNGEDGLLFDVHDVEDLVAKVLMIFSDTELREKLINKGLKKASLFDLPSYIDSLNQIYTEIQS